MSVMESAPSPSDQPRRSGSAPSGASYTPRSTSADVPQLAVSEGTRYAVSFVLLVHLFAVGFGLYVNPSPNNIQARINRLVGPYLQLLSIDTPFRFNHTHGEEMDVGWVLEAEIRTKGGETRVLSTKDLAVAPAVRRDRFYMIARKLAEQATLPGVGEERQMVLARSLARGFLTEWERQGIPLEQIERMELRLRGHVLLMPQEAAAGDNPDAPQRFEAMFAVDVVPQSGGQLPLVNRRNQAAHAVPAMPGTGTQPAGTTRVPTGTSQVPAGTSPVGTELPK